MILVVLSAAVDGISSRNFATGANNQNFPTNFADQYNQTTGTRDWFTTNKPTNEKDLVEPRFVCLVFTSPMPESIKWALDNNITLNSTVKLAGDPIDFSVSWPMFFWSPNAGIHQL